MPERAQTEVLGYALVFAVIVLTVALVTISGQAGLVDLRDSQRTANVEKGFAVLAHNVDGVAQEGVPSRSTELDLSGGQLSLGRPVTVTVKASDTSGGEVFERSRSLRPIVYESPNGARLVYATGAVIIRGKGGNTTMLREPRMLLNTTHTIVPIVNTSLDRQQLRAASDSLDAESRVLIRTERRSRAPVASADETVDLNVTVESSRASAWKPYLEKEIDPGSENCTVGGDSVSCTYQADRATVVVTRIAVRFAQ